MIGDQTDIAGRLRAVLPARWFGDSTPVLDSVLNALASAWAYLHGFLDYTIQQARIASASNVWLDLVARDFFGTSIRRANGQSDLAFRIIVQRNILRPLGTRSALIGALTDLTGRAPLVFEPRNTSDTGGYGSIGGTSHGCGVGYNSQGGWGNLSLPFQCFVTAFRPHANGVAQLGGWAVPIVGYGVGPFEYAGQGALYGQVVDTEILAEITRAAPAGVAIWVNISS